MKKLVDRYLASPIFYDTIVAMAIYAGVYFVFSKCSTAEAYPTKETILSIVSNLIGTCVSLAGFILAALTIIVTFKSNLKVKGIEHSDNALELIFSSHHYDKIVKVYRDAILELVILFIILYFVWLFSDLLVNTLTFATVVGVEMTSFTILRSLFILFTILKLEKHTLESKRQ